MYCLCRVMHDVDRAMRFLYHIVVDLCITRIVVIIIICTAYNVMFGLRRVPWCLCIIPIGGHGVIVVVSSSYVPSACARIVSATIGVAHIAR